MAVFLETINLSKVYTQGKSIRVEALKDVSLTIQEGSFVGVTGPSGSGKSTLLNLLGGLDTPSAGKINVMGETISDLDNEALALYRRKRVGMIFQSYNMIPTYTALENVAFPLLFTGVPKKQRMEKASAMLSRVGLARRRHHKPSELSGGEQQRVAIARALINQPRILLADEPTGNLDSRTSEEILGLLAELHAHEGVTVIMISHEVTLLQSFAEKIIHLHDGRVVNQGKPA